MPMTKIQKETYDVVMAYVKEHRKYPSCTKLAKMLGVGLECARMRMKVLAKNGHIPFIKQDFGQVSKTVISFTKLPTMNPSIQKDFTSLFGMENIFCIDMKGDDYLEFGIHDGDSLVIRRQIRAKDTCIGAIVKDGAVTLKRLSKDSDIQITGVLVGLIRKYEI